MTDEESDAALAKALKRLVQYRRAVDGLDQLDAPDPKADLQRGLDLSFEELVKIIVDRAGSDDHAALLRQIIDAYNSPDATVEDKNSWIGAAILAAVALLAATAGAPLAALAVNDIVWKETVKAAITGALTGLATFATDRALHRRETRETAPTHALQPDDQDIEAARLLEKFDADRPKREPLRPIGWPVTLRTVQPRLPDETKAPSALGVPLPEIEDQTPPEAGIDISDEVWKSDLRPGPPDLS